MTHLEPAHSIIKDLGGIAAVARATGLHFTQVWRWTQAKLRGGTGGTIPQKHHLALLDMARAKGVRLSAADFLPLRVPEGTAAASKRE
jgi:hypothetical protein